MTIIRSIFKPGTVFAVVPALLLAMGSNAVVAQDSNAQDAEADESILEEVVVTGIRQSAFEQRENKRLSDNVTDSIFAEDMGRMPDQNIAEAMQRITGIGIDRQDGEGTFVTVRGVDPNLNIVTMNGQTVTSGEDGNAVDFRSFSADMLRSIEVVKSPSASHVEGSLGGTVNLKTFRPLDIRERRIGLELQAKYNDLADETDPAAKVNYADKFADETFGIAFSSYYDVQSIRQDQFRTFNRFSVRNMPGTSLQTGEDLGDIWVSMPDFFENVLNQTERTRWGGTLSFDWRPDNATDLWLDLTYSELTVDSDEYNIRINRLHRNSANNQNPGRPIPGSWIIDEDSMTAVAGRSEDSGGNHLSRQIETKTKNSFATFGASRIWGPWEGSFELGISRTDQSWPVNRRLNFNIPGPARVLGGYDWINDNGGFHLIPTLEFGPGREPLDPYVLELTQLYQDDRQVDDELDSVQIDLQRDVEWGFVQSIEFGARYFERSKDRTQTIGFTAPNTTETIYLTDENNNRDFPVNDFFSGIANNAVQEWLIPDFNDIYDTYYPEGYLPPRDDINSYVIDQDSLAGYLKANYMFLDGVITGDIGVRWVETDNRSQGYQGTNYPAGQGSVQVPVDLKHSYTNTLPSFNLKYLLSEEMLLRFAVAGVMARPTFEELRPGIVIRATNPNATPTGSGGNPQLDPTEATQWDLSWEWYFGDSGLLSAALFYKDIDTFIFNQTQIRTNIPDPLYSSNGLLLDGGTCLTEDKYDANTCDVAEVPFTIPLNGIGGEIKGLELAYQQNYTMLPGFWGGLGTIINYTYADSEATFYSEGDNDSYNGFPFPNTSEHTANATVYWQQGGHSLRLAYNYRSERLVSPSVLTSSIWADPRDSLDFSANFELSEMFLLTFQAINLTNEYDRFYATRTVSTRDLPAEGNALDGGAPTWRTAELVHTGRTYRLGLRVTF